MRWSQHQLNEYEARNRGQTLARNRPAIPSESELHQQILAECRRRGWLAFHGSMAHSTFRTPGEPDFVILAEGGRTLLVECKSRTGKLSPEQLGVVAWAAKLGHTVHVVRCLADFTALL